MIPSDQMSVRESTVFDDCICSGDMYCGEPSTAEVFVIDGAAIEPIVLSLEMPKSSTFTERSPSASRTVKRFAGLRSRCTMPAACASASASHAWMMNSTAWPTSSGP